MVTFAQSTDLMHLTERQRDGLSILFLAEHAPSPDATEPDTATGGFYVGYHYRLFRELRALGLNVTPCRDLDGFAALAPAYDYVFTIYNRIWTRPMRNSMVLVSSLCDYLGIPYLGAPPNIRALAEDKYLTKALAVSAGIPVLPVKVYHELCELDSAPGFAGPYFVKPRFGAASEQITVDSFQTDWPGARSRAGQILEQGMEVLVERGIVGTDITVPVVGGKAPLFFPAIARPSGMEHGITTHQQKIFSTRPQQIVEDRHLQDRINRHVLRLSEEARPFDYFRVDFRQDDSTGELFLLEFNVACVLDRDREFGTVARHRDIPFSDLLSHIIAYSLARQEAVKSNFTHQRQAK